METLESLKKEIAALKQENENLRSTERSALSRREEDSAYQKTQTRFHTVFESSRLGNKIISPDLSILEVNPALVSLLGYSTKEELIGSRILDHSPLEHHSHWQSLQEKLWQGSLPSFTLETCLRKKDGETVWCKVTSILFEDNGQNLGYTIIEEISDKGALRIDKDAFINMASHELKTPLTSLKAVVQLMNMLIRKEIAVKGKIVELAKDAERYIGKLAHLVEDLLRTTKLGLGQLQLHKSSFTINDLVESGLNHIKLKGSHRITYAGDLSISVIADKHTIEQVLVNLVNNAVKYGQDAAEIIIRANEEEGVVKISVTDHGTGIPKQYVPHVFERYFRAGENGNQASGMGLGLYIASEIIRKHDGDIGVDTEPGRGSTFWFTLPKAPDVNSIR